MSWRLVNVAGRAAFLDGEHYFDLADVTAGVLGPDPMAALARADLLDAVSLAGRRPTGRIDDAVLQAPVPRPGQVFGIGLNYRAHSEEFSIEAPPEPMVFTKFPSSIAGPRADVRLSGDQVDWEVELVVVMGQTAKNVAVDEAWSKVAGITVGQDVSDRVLQFRGPHPQFSLAKSFDTYGPIGPCVVSRQSFALPLDLEIRCEVSGEEMQRSRTGQMIFDVRQLIAYLSSIVTLGSGDLIFTGTPEGVGMARGRYLRPGDVLRSYIAGIGELENRCIAGSRTRRLVSSGR